MHIKHEINQSINPLTLSSDITAPTGAECYSVVFEIYNFEVNNTNSAAYKRVVAYTYNLN